MMAQVAQFGPTGGRRDTHLRARRAHDGQLGQSLPLGEEHVLELMGAGSRLAPLYLSAVGLIPSHCSTVITGERSTCSLHLADAELLALELLRELAMSSEVICLGSRPWIFSMK
jgi:hypothetical protein